MNHLSWPTFLQRMINRCFIQNCIHILVGFYLPTTFLSSLFQQVCTQSFQTFTPSQPFNGCIIQVCISCTISNWITSHKCNTSQRFITVFTICIHILGIWSPYNLSFIGCFIEFMYTIINHVKPLQPFNDCLQVCISCTKLLRTSAILFSWLNGLSLITVFTALPRCTTSSFISYHCTSRITHNKLEQFITVQSYHRPDKLSLLIWSCCTLIADLTVLSL